MLKKLMIGSSIVLLVCLLAAAVLTPMAVADTIDVAETVVDRYSVVHEQLSISSDGVVIVSSENGRSIEKLIVKPSPDNKIHVYTDGFHQPDSQFTYVLDEEAKFLSLSNYWRGDYNVWRSLTRENILKQIVREFSNYTPYVELQLPSGVAYDLDSPNVWSVEVDPLVACVHSGRYESPWDVTDMSTDEGDGDESPTTTDDIDAVSGLTAEQMLEITRTVMAQNDLMIKAYQTYSDGGSQTAFWNTAHPCISTTAPLLARLSADMEEWEQEELADYLNQYMVHVAEKSLIEITQDLFEQEYRKGQIDKATYYEMDLEYDRQQDDLETQIEEINLTYNLEGLFDRCEIILGFELVLADDIDLGDLTTLR